MLTTEQRAAARIIWLERPKKRNALVPEMLAALRDALAAADADPETVGIVLTGSGAAFCSGVDLDVVRTDPGAFAGWDVVGWFSRVRKPIIAAVNGPALTGGMELALNADLRLLAPEATFADTHVRVGVVPGWGMTALLPALVGQARATELSLSARTVEAEEAVKIGLGDRLVARGGVVPAAIELVSAIAEGDATTRSVVLGLYRDQSNSRLRDALHAEARASESWFASQEPFSSPSLRED